MKTYQISLMSQVTLLSHLFETLYEIKRLKWKTTHITLHMLNIYLDYSTVYNYNISFYEDQNHAILCNAAKLYSKVFNLVKALKGRLYGGFNLKCGI